MEKPKQTQTPQERYEELLFNIKALGAAIEGAQNFEDRLYILRRDAAREMEEKKCRD